jgi:putative RNA 2'-phosphotransferase
MAKLNVEKRRDNLEKLLIYMLGVSPDEFGLLPDKDGFVPFKELLAAVRQEEGFRGVTEGSVIEIVNRPTGESQLETEGGLIRVKPPLVDYDLTPPKVKPKILYLAVKPTAWPSISEHGLGPKPNEDYVRLFPTTEAALKVYSRFCPNPVLITVNLVKADNSGAVIEAFSDKLYKTKALKPEVLSGPPVPQKPEGQEGKTSPKADLPGQSLKLTVEPLAHHGKKKGKFQDSPEWKVRTRIDRRKDKEG